MSLNQRSSANPANRNAVLDRRISSGEDLTRDLPSRWAGGAGASHLYTISVTGGNTLASGQTGIKYDATADDAVPSAYDPSVTSTFIDGIGRGILSIDGVPQSGSVLIANAGGGGIDFALVATDIIVVASTVDIPVTGGGGTTVTAYIPLFM